MGMQSVVPLVVGIVYVCACLHYHLLVVNEYATKAIKTPGAVFCVNYSPGNFKCCSCHARSKPALLVGERCPVFCAHVAACKALRERGEDIVPNVTGLACTSQAYFAIAAWRQLQWKFAGIENVVCLFVSHAFQTSQTTNVVNVPLDFA